MTRHYLNLPAEDDNGTVSVSCSCGNWSRQWASFDYMPQVQEVESEHEEHRRLAGAEELRAAGQGGLDALVAMTNAMAEAMAVMAEWGAVVEGFLAGFATARAQANKNGVGVVVVREADGKVTSTASAYVEAGTVLFIDSPAVNDEPPQLRLVPDLDEPVDYLALGYQPLPGVVIPPNLSVITNVA